MARSVPIVRSIQELRRRVARWRRDRLRLALVPTMGALHEGHLSLVDAGFRNAERVVVSIFVNPTQFAPSEDLARYPRDEAGDLAKLAARKASLIFAPQLEEMYPPDFATRVTLDGPATAGLEDRFRPHFFGGVATIVAKLLLQAQCDIAMFGEKDYQQLLVVTRMARDLDIPTRIVAAATVREADGLALSSRNAYLDEEERAIAPHLYATLAATARRIRDGEPLPHLLEEGRKVLEHAGFRVDYFEARHAATLALPGSPGEPLRLLAAAWLGKTRLIDNVAV